MGLSLGITLLREASLLAVALKDKETLARLAAEDFHDDSVRKALAAAKRIADKPNPGDLAILRGVCETLWGVAGEGKVLDLLEEKVRCETREAKQQAAVRSLLGRFQTRQITASQLIEATKRL